MINKDKLTPFDTQILNMIALSPGAWALSDRGMAHQHFGDFVRSLWGWGLQAASTKSSTPQYRRLTWRGQLLLRYEWERMLVQAVDGPSTRPDLSASGMMAAQQMMGIPGPQGPMGPPGLSAAQQFARAMQGHASQPTLLGGIISAADISEIQKAALEQFRQNQSNRLTLRLTGVDLAAGPDGISGGVANKSTGS